MLQCEFPLGHVTGIGFTKDSMPVTRNHLSAFQSGPDVLANSLVRCVFSDDVLHFAEPNKDLLVGKPVKRTSEAIQSRTKGKEGVRES